MPARYEVKSFVARPSCSRSRSTSTTLEQFFGRHARRRVAPSACWPRGAMPVASPANSEEFVAEPRRPGAVRGVLPQLHAQAVGRPPPRPRRPACAAASRCGSTATRATSITATRSCRPRASRRCSPGCSTTAASASCSTARSGRCGAWSRRGGRPSTPARSTSTSAAASAGCRTARCVRVRPPTTPSSSSRACRSTTRTTARSRGRSRSSTSPARSTRTTVVSHEAPAATGEPYYPVPTAASAGAWPTQYRAAGRRRDGPASRVYFCGRLAQYRYFNTDEVIQEALACFQQMRRDCVPRRAPCASSPRTHAA